MADETEPGKAAWAAVQKDWSAGPFPRRGSPRPHPWLNSTGATLSPELLITTQVALSRKIFSTVHYPQVFKGPRDELAMLAKPTRGVLLELCATGIEVFQR